MFQFVPTVSDPVTGHHWKEPGFLFLIFPIWYLYTWVKFPIAFASPDWRAPGLSASPHIPVLSSSPCPLCSTVSLCPCLSCAGEPRTASSFPYGSHQCWLAGKLISLVPAGSTSAAQRYQRYLPGPSVFSCQVVFQLVVLHPVLPQIQNFELVEFHEVPVSPFSSCLSQALDGSTVLWCISNSVLIQCWPLGCSLNYHSLNNHHPLGLAMQFSVLLTAHPAHLALSEGVMGSKASLMSKQVISTALSFSTETVISS